MRPVMHPRRHAAGFTLIEIMVAVVILSILLAVGIPTMGKWMSSNRALAATEFYAEGFKLARSEALKRNAASRLVLTDNSNGQQDWQVDICMPTPAAPCRADSGSWSTATTAAAGTGLEDFRSVTRSASVLPNASLIALTLAPAGASDVYFTSVGWVDGTNAPNLNLITIAPAAGREGDFPTAAVSLTLAGVVSKCKPVTSASTAIDSRNCP